MTSFNALSYPSAQSTMLCNRITHSNIKVRRGGNPFIVHASVQPAPEVVAPAPIVTAEPPEEELVPPVEPNMPDEEDTEDETDGTGRDSNDDGARDNAQVPAAAREETPDDEDDEGPISRGVIVAIVAGVLVVFVVAVVAVLFGGRGCGSSKPPPPPPIMETPLPSPHGYYGGATDAVYGATAAQAQGTKYFVPPGGPHDYTTGAGGYQQQQRHPAANGYGQDYGGAHGGANGSYQNGAPGYDDGGYGGGYQGGGGGGGYQNGGYQKSPVPLPPDHPANAMYDHLHKQQMMGAQLPSDPYATPVGGDTTIGADHHDAPRRARTPSFDALANAAAPAMAAAAAADARKRSGSGKGQAKHSRTSSHASMAPDGSVSPAGGSVATAPPKYTDDGNGGNYMGNPNVALPVEEDPYSEPSSAHQSLFYVTDGTPKGQGGPEGSPDGNRREEAQDFLHQHEAKHVTVVPGEAAGESAQTLLKTLSKNARQAGYIPEGPGVALVKQLDWIEENKKGLLLGKYKYGPSVLLACTVLNSCGTLVSSVRRTIYTASLCHGNSHFSHR